ncbi:hypothetical protein HUJ05_006107 [Dendroctonus ponderosae]|nr:hypothetical protein HUJ05_006107 [Dendroctonus ponderosae]
MLSNSPVVYITFNSNDLSAKPTSTLHIRLFAFARLACGHPYKLEFRGSGSGTGRGMGGEGGPSSGGAASGDSKGGTATGSDQSL